MMNLLVCNPASNLQYIFQPSRILIYLQVFVTLRLEGIIRLIHAEELLK